MKKKVEEIDMVVDGMPTETEPVATEVVAQAFTATKIIDNGLTTYTVDAPVEGRAKLTIAKNLGTGNCQTTIKLIDLTEAEFADEALLKAKLIK